MERIKKKPAGLSLYGDTVLTTTEAVTALVGIPSETIGTPDRNEYYLRWYIETDARRITILELSDVGLPTARNYPVKMGIYATDAANSVRARDEYIIALAPD